MSLGPPRASSFTTFTDKGPLIKKSCLCTCNICASLSTSKRGIITPRTHTPLLLYKLKHKGRRERETSLRSSHAAPRFALDCTHVLSAQSSSTHRGQTSREVFRFISLDFIHNEVESQASIYLIAVECKCILSHVNGFLYF